MGRRPSAPTLPGRFCAKTAASYQPEAFLGQRFTPELDLVPGICADGRVASSIGPLLACSAVVACVWQKSLPLRPGEVSPCRRTRPASPRPGIHVPEDEAPFAVRHQRVTVRAERRISVLSRLGERDADLLTAGHVVETHGSVVAARGQHPPVGAEGHRLHDACTNCRRTDGFERPTVPEGDLPVRGTGGEELAVGAESHPDDAERELIGQTARSRG